MEPFFIHCTTCRARLKVVDEAAIGDILECPKCGSMVQVLPPAGRQPGATGPTTAPRLAPETKSSRPAANPLAAKSTVAQPATAKLTDSKSSLTASSGSASTVLPPAPAKTPSTNGSASKAPSVSAAAPETPASTNKVAAAAHAATPAPPPLPTHLESPPQVHAAAISTLAAIAQPPGAPVSLFSGAGLVALWRRDWPLLSGGAVAGIGLGVLIWLVLVSWGRNETPAIEQSAQAQATDSAIKQPPVDRQQSALAKNASDENPSAEVATAPITKNADRRPATAEPAVAKPAETAASKIEPAADVVTSRPVDASAPPGTSAEAASVASSNPSKSSIPAAGKVEAAAADPAKPLPASATGQFSLDRPAPATVAAAPRAEMAPVVGLPPTARVEPGDAVDDLAPAALTSVKRSQIEARLAEHVPSIDFRDARLLDFVNFLAGYSTLPIGLDREALAAVGKGPDSLVTVQLKNATVGQALRTAISKHGLMVVFQDDKLVIKPKAK